MVDNTPHTPDPELLSRYLDGDLSPSEAGRVSSHLAGCEPCRAELESLRQLVGAAGELGGVEPSRDLWPGIARAILAEGIPAQPTRRAPAPRRWWSSPRAAAIAAGLALVLFSGVGGYVLRDLVGGGAPEAIVEAGDPVQAQLVALGLPANTLELMAELEAALRTDRDQLDEETRAVLEENLASLDQAIYEAREALRIEPGSEYLSAHLASAMRQKMRVLEQARDIRNDGQRPPTEL